MSEMINLSLSLPAELSTRIRIRMAGTPDSPLFCLRDVCDVLGVANATQVADRIDDDEKTTLCLTEGVGGPPRLFITEAGLYTVLLRSDKPEAKPFRKWVTGEVIPCVRKHGSYPAPKHPKQTELPWHQRLASYVLDHMSLLTQNHPDDWTVITAAYPYIQAMELSLVEHLLPTSSYDLADGSIAGCWSNHRYHKLKRARLTPRHTAAIYSPIAGEMVAVIVYPHVEMLDFIRWMKATYIPEKCAEYFRRKYKGNLKNLAPVSAADHFCHRATGSEARLRNSERRLLSLAGGVVRLGDKSPGEQLALPGFDLTLN